MKFESPTALVSLAYVAVLSCTGLSGTGLPSARMSFMPLLNGVALAEAEEVRPDIEQLMTETNLHELADASLKQMSEAFERQFVGSLQGNPQSKEIVAKMMERLKPILQKELGWSVMKSEYAKMYEETFSPAEVKGLIEFYHTPIGQSFLKKMPALGQRVAEASAQRVKTIMPEVQKVAMEVSAEMQKAAPPTPVPAK